MDSSELNNKRLVDIKKQLGIDRAEAYKVFTFTNKGSGKPHVTSAPQLQGRPTKPKRSIPSRWTQSVIITSSSTSNSISSILMEGNKPVPSPKPRRAPPKPPPYNGTTVVSETPPLTPPMSADSVKKVPPKPKPRMNLPSKSRSFDKSPESQSPTSCSPVPKIKSSCSIEENLQSSIDSRPRLSTPTKFDPPGPDINLPATPEPVMGQSLVVDSNGMAVVTNNHRPTAYCVVDLDDKGSGKIIETSNNPSGGLTEVTSTDQVHTNNNIEYNTTTHSNSTSKLDQHYASFDRQNKPSTPYGRAPEYDEIDINVNTQRPMLITRTAGYSTLGSTSTTNERTPSLTPKSYPSPKPPRPDPPRKPTNIPPPNRKSSGSSREQSPSSPSISPAHRKPPLSPYTSPKHKPNGVRDSSGDQNGNTSASPRHEAETQHQDFCEIDISAILARTGQSSSKLDKENNDGEGNKLSPKKSSQNDLKLFNESMVKFDEVVDKSLLPKKVHVDVSHMYESLPWDTPTTTQTIIPSVTPITNEKTTPKTGRRKAPPPPTSAPVRTGSPTLLRKKPIPEDPNKALTLGRKPRHLTVMPTKSIDSEDDDRSLPPSQPPPAPPTINKQHSQESPSTAGKSKKFWKGGLRGSKKNKKKSSQFLNTVSVEVTSQSKSSTLPARARGRSVDPYMAAGIYSTINMEDSQGSSRDKRSPSPLPQAFAYSVIDARDVPLRSKPLGMKGHRFRRSQSVEHIYEFGRSLDSISTTSTFSKSPLSLDDSNIKLSPRHSNGVTSRGDSPLDDDGGRVSLSPIRDVPHVSVGDGLVYAVVSKPNKNSSIGDSQSPPPLPPSRLVGKPLPPPPYKPTDNTANDSVHATPPLTPPAGTLSNERDSSKNNKGKFSRAHTYDTVDLDTPGHVVVEPVPLRCPKPGKVRTLKPKDKPAPLPPTLQHSSSPAMSKQSSISESSEGPHSRLSTSTSDGTISATGYYDYSDSSEFEPPSSDEEDEDDLNKSSTQSQLRKSKTYYIAEEILTTERTFVRGLTLLHHDFRSHMLSSNTVHDKVVISEDVLNLILSSNLGGIHQLNSELLKELEDRLKNWESKPKLGDIFVGRAPFLKLYSPYISNFDKALKTLEEYSKKNQLFAQVLKDFEVQPKCNNLTVAAYLLETVQRIPRYKLLLADYIKHLPSDSDDREDSEKAYEIIASVASHVNDTIKQIENFRKIIEVSKRLIGDVGDSLISPHRKLLKEGELTKSSRKEKQVRMFFLFTDLLVYASAIPPANTTFRVIKRIPLDGMKIQELDDPEMKHSFQIISTCKSFRLEASSQEDRDSWMKAFEGAVKDHINRIQSRQVHRRSMMLPDSIDGVQDGNSSEGTLGMFAPPWLPDSSVSMCQLCGIHFTVTRRRHHCRACGMIFCGECSGYMVPLPYKNNKPCRVCQTCCTTLTEMDNSRTTPDQSLSKPTSLKGKSKRMSSKKISMPSVLREVRARDDSAHISGYLFYRKDKAKQWKKKWFVVYNLVMYEFKRHEDVTAKQSIPLPSYSVSRAVQGFNDPLVFSLEHSGAGRIVFKADDEDMRERWVGVLEKAVKGEMDDPPLSP